MASNSSILKTLIYSDVFDYPLTKEEIWKFLIGKNINKDSFEKELNRLVRFEATPLGCNRNLYYLLGREEIIQKRIKRKKESRKKLEAAKKIIRTFSLIPTVLFVGISGGLALENSDGADDIDLFVITSKNTLWITRLTLVLLLKLMGQYRGRGNPKVSGESNKICLNMLINEKGLMFEKSRQNLYTAHEIAQLKPIFDRNNTYREFMNANRWVSKFLPNAMDRIRNYESSQRPGFEGQARVMRKENPLFIIHYSLFILESIAKVFQLWYMKKHRTKETISDHMLAFHPFEYKDYVLGEYNKRMKRYEV